MVPDRPGPVAGRTEPGRSAPSGGALTGRPRLPGFGCPVGAWCRGPGPPSLPRRASGQSGRAPPARTPVTDLRLPTPGELALALRPDRPALQRLLARIERARAQGKPHDRNLRRLLADLQRSVELRRAREASRPTTSY